MNVTLASKPFEKRTITANTQALLQFIDFADRHPQTSLVDAKRELRFSTGQMYRVSRDGETAQLITKSRGRGVEVTDLGKRLLNAYRHTNRIPLDILRQSFLNADLFKTMYQELNNVTDFKTLKEFLNTHSDGKTNITTIGTATRRYLEGVYGIEVGKRTANTLANELVNRTQENTNKHVDRYSKLIIALKVLEKEFSDFTGQEITKIWDAIKIK